MRSVADRLRHTFLFEIIALSIVTPIGAWAFNQSIFDMGILGLMGATIATTWNYLYNWGFDHLMQWKYNTTLKSPKLRLAHAISYEISLLGFLLPMFCLYLGITLVEAFLMDISFSMFFLVYALVFNWAYDLIFPLPEWEK